MKTSLIALGVLAGVTVSSVAEAKTVTLTTTMRNYGGNGAYLAIYLTDPQGKVKTTLHLAAPKAKYHRHLKGWASGAPAARRTIDGVTGASVGSGRTLKVSVDIADALIDAGYQIRIDSAVEDGRDIASEVVAPLAGSSVGTPVAGKGYVKTFKFDM